MILLKSVVNELRINDLGIILKENEQTYLHHFNEVHILESEDLKIAMQNSECEVYIDNTIYDYVSFIRSFIKITEEKHERLKTLTHNLFEDSFMKTTKENNQVKYITYFTDSTMSKKTREEEIIRDMNGKSLRIISRVYDIEQNVVNKEEQILNRDEDGKVGSISIIKN